MQEYNRAYNGNIDMQTNLEVPTCWGGGVPTQYYNINLYKYIMFQYYLLLS